MSEQTGGCNAAKEQENQTNKSTFTSTATTKTEGSVAAAAAEVIATDSNNVHAQSKKRSSPEKDHHQETTPSTSNNKRSRLQGGDGDEESGESNKEITIKTEDTDYMEVDQQEEKLESRAQIQDGEEMNDQQDRKTEEQGATSVVAESASHTTGGGSASYVDYHWLDAGEIVEGNKSPARRIHKMGIQLTMQGRQLEVRPGDTVQLLPPEEGDENDENERDKGAEKVQQRWFCRVQELWEPVLSPEHDNASTASVVSVATASQVQFRGQWMYSRHEVAQFRGNWSGVLTQAQLLDQMIHDRELVLSDHAEDNAISAIMKKVRVVYHDPSSSRKTPPLLPNDEDSLLVRYKITHTYRTWNIAAWKPESRDGDEHEDEGATTTLGAPTDGSLPPVSARAGAARAGRGRDNDSLSSVDEGAAAAPDVDMGSDDDDEDEDENSSMNSEDDREELVAMPEGEGSQLRAEISVGPTHQARVPKFNANNLIPVKSRNPKLVWSRDSGLSEEDLHNFCNQLAEIVNPYLREQGMTMVDPYSPLSAEMTEQAILMEHAQAQAENNCHNKTNLHPSYNPLIRTGSHISTASRLSTKPNALLKECNADAVLELLHSHAYDTKAALAAVQQQKQDQENDECENGVGPSGSNKAVPTAAMSALTSLSWTRTEKRTFDEAFRHGQGSLRRVAETMDMPLKNVVDYWFRFKIPDQFRLYQDKKRNQALRMMECIEKRRYHQLFANTNNTNSNNDNNNSTLKTTTASSSHQPLMPLPSSTGDSALGTDAAQAAVLAPSRRPQQQKKQHWSEVTALDVTGAVEDRRQSAKTLLLDVQNRLGQVVMSKVAAVVRELHKSYSNGTKEELFEILEGCPDLQRRFQEFLPINC